MYNVSADYITAINKPARFRRLTGTIGSVGFSDVNISNSSFKIEHQCTDDLEVRIGTVYMGILTATFKDINLLGQWKNKVIRPSEGLLIGENTFEDVPLGVYTIVEANLQDDGVAVTAYDNMRKLDKKIVFSTTNGTPYDYLSMIQSDCRIVLAQTENEIRALPNGTKAYVLNPENDIETYRDLLAYVAQVTCTFATIDRQGRLELRQYGYYTDPVDTIGASTRFRGSSFSDFETYYTGIELTRIEDDTTIYRSFPEDDGLTYKLGANPLLQSGNVDTSLQEILEALQAIRYTPYEISRSAFPAYDLGDVIEFEDGNGEGKVGCLMSYEYTYHSVYVMKGVGSNPELMDARTKTDKEISGLMRSNSVANQIQFYTYTNAAPYTVQSDYKEIIKIRFGANKDTIATFHAEIKLDAESLSQGVDKVIGNIKYIFNNVELDYKPAETWIEGDHLLHLLYYFPVDGSSLNNLSVRMNTDGLVSIDRTNIQASISGQGLVATSSWDGYIEIEETIHPVAFATTPKDVVAFGQEIDTDTIAPHKRTPTEEIGVIRFSTTPRAINFVDGMSVNKHPVKGLKWINVRQTTVGGETTVHKWSRYKDYYTW